MNTSCVTSHLLFHKKLIPSILAFLLGLCIGMHTLQNLLLNAPIGKIPSALAFIVTPFFSDAPCTWSSLPFSVTYIIVCKMTAFGDS